MEICDMINDTEEGPKDAIKAIRKRLSQNAGKNHKIIMYTLTVSIISFVITNNCCLMFCCKISYWYYNRYNKV